MSWRNAVAAIFTPKEGGGGNDGTGTLVAPRLVLTARHVVFSLGEDGRWKHSEAPVRLRWQSTDSGFDASSGDKKNGYHDAIEENGDRGIAWECKELDIALVRCKAPVKVSPVPLSNIPPGDGESWSSEVHPSGIEGAWKESEYILGKASSLKGSGSSARFSLLSEVVKRERDRQPVDIPQWSGVSGAGVVAKIDEISQIIGVITTENIHFNSYFDASPVCVALNDERFRRLVEPVRSSFYVDVEKALSALSKDSREKLENGMGVIHVQSCESLAAALQKILDTLNGKPPAQEIRLLNELARCLFAKYLSTLEVVPTHISAAQDCEIEVPTGQQCGAEGFMAAAEGRAPEYRLNETLDPPGKRNLNAPPPISFSQEDQDDLAELEGRTAIDLGRFDDVTAKRLNRNLGNLTSSADRTYRRKAIIVRLKKLKQRSEGRFYLAYPATLENLGRAIERVKKEYEGLVPVLKLCTDNQIAQELLDPVLILAEILTFEEGEG